MEDRCFGCEREWGVLDMAREMFETRRPWYHFSVDDVFDALIEVSDRQLPLFEHPFFRFLKEVHDEFGSHVSLYLFYQKSIQGRMRTLAGISEANAVAWEDNQWLQLGPHALDPETPPYAQSPSEQRKTFDAIYAELERFAAKGKRSKWVRLHYFSESYELAEYLKTKGVEALLSTDKEAVSYRLPIREKEQLRNEDVCAYRGMTFIRSHLRIETLVHDGVSSCAVYGAIKPILSRLGHIVIMTHEYELARPEVRAMTVSTLWRLKEHGVYSL